MNKTHAFNTNPKRKPGTDWHRSRADRARILINRATCLVAMVVLLMPVCAFGQITALWQPAKAEKPESERSLPIVLHGARPALPALEYQFLPPYWERHPGNAAVLWNRITAERTDFFRAFERSEGVWEKVDKWMEIPLGDPREKQSRPKAEEVLSTAMFNDMDRAARFESCDWELPMHDGNVISMLIPEVQQTRGYGRLLSAKARLEIVEGKYDQAVRTLQTGFALARDVAKGPTLIHSLVGTAISAMMLDRVREITQQPGGPSLYWALSTLPQPLIDFRPGFDAEGCGLYLELPELQGLDKKQLPPEQWRELLLKLVRELRVLDNKFGPDLDTPLMTGLALQGYPKARQYLVDHGRSEAEVEAMPVAQVIVLYTVRVYDELRDEQFKWLYLPYAEATQGMERAERGLKEAIAAGREVIPIAGMLLPAVQSCKQAETRLAWQVARLRILEALRLYAESHGHLPDRLAEITEVPIPANPYDGKPFAYRRDGEKADLGCEAGPRGLPWRYEITLSK
jgi:hypothetical protein